MWSFFIPTVQLSSSWSVDSESQSEPVPCMSHHMSVWTLSHWISTCPDRFLFSTHTEIQNVTKKLYPFIKNMLNFYPVRTSLLALWQWELRPRIPSDSPICYGSQIRCMLKIWRYAGQTASYRMIAQCKFKQQLKRLHHFIHQWHLQCNVSLSYGVNTMWPEGTFFWNQKSLGQMFQWFCCQQTEPRGQWVEWPRQGGVDGWLEKL